MFSRTKNLLNLFLTVCDARWVRNPKWQLSNKSISCWWVAFLDFCLPHASHIIVGKASTLLRLWRRCSWMVQVLFVWSVPVHPLQWCPVWIGPRPLRGTSGISPRTCVVYSVFCRCHQYRHQTRLFCSFLRRRSSDFWSFYRRLWLNLVPRMSACIEEISTWMASNRLQLNPSKTELIWLGSSRRLKHCPMDALNIAGVSIKPSSYVWYLGVYVDGDLYLWRLTFLISPARAFITFVSYVSCAGVSPRTPLVVKVSVNEHVIVAVAHVLL